MQKFKCIYVPEYNKYSGHKSYRLTKNKVYSGEDKGNGYILIKNNYGEFKSYHSSNFIEI